MRQVCIAEVRLQRLQNLRNLSQAGSIALFLHPCKARFFFSHLVKALHIPDAVSRELPGGVKAGWTLEQNATYVRSCLHGFCWKLPFWHFGTAPILSKRLKTIAARLYLRYVRSNVQTIVYFVVLRSPTACLLHWPTDCPLSCP